MLQLLCRCRSAKREKREKKSKKRKEKKFKWKNDYRDVDADADAVSHNDKTEQHNDERRDYLAASEHGQNVEDSAQIFENIPANKTVVDKLPTKTSVRNGRNKHNRSGGDERADPLYLAVKETKMSIISPVEITTERAIIRYGKLTRAPIIQNQVDDSAIAVPTRQDLSEPRLCDDFYIDKKSRFKNEVTKLVSPLPVIGVKDLVQEQNLEADVDENGKIRTVETEEQSDIFAFGSSSNQCGETPRHSLSAETSHRDSVTIHASSLEKLESIMFSPKDSKDSSKNVKQLSLSPSTSIVDCSEREGFVRDENSETTTQSDPFYFGSISPKLSLEKGLSSSSSFESFIREVEEETLTTSSIVEIYGSNKTVCLDPPLEGSQIGQEYNSDDTTDCNRAPSPSHISTLDDWETTQIETNSEKCSTNVVENGIVDRSLSLSAGALDGEGSSNLSLAAGSENISPSQSAGAPDSEGYPHLSVADGNKHISSSQSAGAGDGERSTDISVAEGSKHVFSSQSAVAPEAEGSTDFAVAEGSKHLFSTKILPRNQQIGDSNSDDIGVEVMALLDGQDDITAHSNSERVVGAKRIASDRSMSDEPELVNEIYLSKKTKLCPAEKELTRVDGWASYGIDGVSLSFRILGTSVDDEKSRPHVLSPILMECLRSFLPFVCSEDNFLMKYSLSRDGASLGTLLSKVRGSHRTILAVETLDGEVFGSFTSTPWRIHTGYFGSGESFLWRLKSPRFIPSRTMAAESRLESDVEVYFFTGFDDYVQICSHDRIGIGGGEWKSGESPYPNEPNGVAILLKEYMDTGSSFTCSTFANPTLAKKTKRGGNFQIANVEVWTLTPFSTMKEAEAAESRRLFIEEHTSKTKS